MRQLRKLTPMRQLRTPGQVTRAESSSKYKTKMPVYKGPKKDQRKHVVRRLKDFPPGTPQSTPCILWQGAVDKQGYGAFKNYIDGKKYTYKVHRWAFEQAYGIKRLRPDQVILHMCDNPPCFRVSHLLVGTIADNNADAVAKGRNIKPPVMIMRGPDNPEWKWTPEREEIFAQMRTEGYAAQEIADAVGLSKATVYRHINYVKGLTNGHSTDHVS